MTRCAFFVPDPDIFADAGRRLQLYRMARVGPRPTSSRGVEIRWSCDSVPAPAPTACRVTARLRHFPNGLGDFLTASLDSNAVVTPRPFQGQVALADGGSVEWAVTWPEDEDDGFCHSYCNTIPTPEGGTHETGLRNALTRGIKGYGELISNRRIAQATADDVTAGAAMLLSLFLRDPQFQGQTKEHLALDRGGAARRERAQGPFRPLARRRPGDDAPPPRRHPRARRGAAKAAPGKGAVAQDRDPPRARAANCAPPRQAHRLLRDSAEGTEIFLVEGDSAGGSAKQARDRVTQAILPLRGKILNVASASLDKMRANQEISDIILALGADSGSRYKGDALRYERVVIMTDADVDGAHIATLLMTFFFREMPKLVDNGHLYLALPPLYRLTQGDTTF